MAGAALPFVDWIANVAQRYSLNTLVKVTRLQSVHTVEKYLRHLEEAFLIFSLRRFSYTVREQARSNRKVYCTDNGFITSASFRFAGDLGKLYENIVAIELRKREIEGALECFYWQGAQQEEVDVSSICPLRRPRSSVRLTGSSNPEGGFPSLTSWPLLQCPKTSETTWHL